jgi:hypothetical protein
VKEKLHRLIDAARAKEEATLVPRVNDEPPPVAGRWTAKDQLAHLTSWRVFAAGEVDANRRGEPMPDVSLDDDVANVKFYAETHDLPAAEVIARARASWDGLAAAVDAASEEVLLRPRLRRPKQPQWQTVPNNTWFHLAEHLGYWYSEQGDEAGAEDAAKWGYELAVSTYPEDRIKGMSEYNLACFYAKRGRTREALPRLKLAFELRPELREVAKQDTDLEPIRAEVMKLLA